MSPESETADAIPLALRLLDLLPDLEATVDDQSLLMECAAGAHLTQRQRERLCELAGSADCLQPPRDARRNALTRNTKPHCPE